MLALRGPLIIYWSLQWIWFLERKPGHLTIMDPISWQLSQSFNSPLTNSSTLWCHYHRLSRIIETVVARYLYLVALCCYSYVLYSSAVPPEMPTIAGFVEGRSVAAGSAQTLTCTSVGGNPPATLAWWKGKGTLVCVYNWTFCFPPFNAHSTVWLASIFPNGHPSIYLPDSTLCNDILT